MKNQRSNSARVAQRARSFLSNALFYGCISCGTMASAVLPFYIHFHSEEFGPPLMHFSGEMGRNADFEASVETRRERQIATLVKPMLQIDKIVTGSIRDRALGSARAAPAEQPYPENAPSSPLALEILFVSPNRALIIDGGRVETIRPGSRLSNGAQVESIVWSNGRWSIKTSAGASYEWAKRN